MSPEEKPPVTTCIFCDNPDCVGHGVAEEKPPVCDCGVSGRDTKAPHALNCSTRVAEEKPKATPMTASLVGGRRMERSIADFARACEVLLADEQECACPNNALVAVLCDAVRLTRESPYARLKELEAQVAEKDAALNKVDAILPSEEWLRDNQDRYLCTIQIEAAVIRRARAALSSSRSEAPE